MEEMPMPTKRTLLMQYPHWPVRQRKSLQMPIKIVYGEQFLQLLETVTAEMNSTKPQFSSPTNLCGKHLEQLSGKTDVAESEQETAQPSTSKRKQRRPQRRSPASADDVEAGPSDDKYCSSATGKGEKRKRQDMDGNSDESQIEVEEGSIDEEQQKGETEHDDVTSNELKMRKRRKRGCRGGIKRSKRNKRKSKAVQDGNDTTMPESFTKSKKTKMSADDDASIPETVKSKNKKTNLSSQDNKAATREHGEPSKSKTNETTPSEEDCTTILLESSKRKIKSKTRASKGEDSTMLVASKQKEKKTKTSKGEDSIRSASLKEKNKVTKTDQKEDDTMTESSNRRNTKGEISKEEGSSTESGHDEKKTSIEGHSAMSKSSERKSRKTKVSPKEFNTVPKSSKTYQEDEAAMAESLTRKNRKTKTKVPPKGAGNKTSQEDEVEVEVVGDCKPKQVVQNDSVSEKQEGGDVTTVQPRSQNRKSRYPKRKTKNSLQEDSTMTDSRHEDVTKDANRDNECQTEVADDKSNSLDDKENDDNVMTEQSASKKGKHSPQEREKEGTQVERKETPEIDVDDTNQKKRQSLKTTPRVHLQDIGSMVGGDLTASTDASSPVTDMDHGKRKLRSHSSPPLPSTEAQENNERPKKTVREASTTSKTDQHGTGDQAERNKTSGNPLDSSMSETDQPQVDTNTSVNSLSELLRSSPTDKPAESDELQEGCEKSDSPLAKLASEKECTIEPSNNTEESEHASNPLSVTTLSTSLEMNFDPQEPELNLLDLPSDGSNEEASWRASESSLSSSLMEEDDMQKNMEILENADSLESDDDDARVDLTPISAKKDVFLVKQYNSNESNVSLYCDEVMPDAESSLEENIPEGTMDQSNQNRNTSRADAERMLEEMRRHAVSPDSGQKNTSGLTPRRLFYDDSPNVSPDIPIVGNHGNMSAQSEGATLERTPESSSNDKVTDDASPDVKTASPDAAGDHVKLDEMTVGMKDGGRNAEDEKDSTTGTEDGDKNGENAVRCDNMKASDVIRSSNKGELGTDQEVTPSEFSSDEKVTTSGGSALKDSCKKDEVEELSPKTCIKMITGNDREVETSEREDDLSEDEEVILSGGSANKESCKKGEKEELSPSSKIITGNDEKVEKFERDDELRQDEEAAISRRSPAKEGCEGISPRSNTTSENGEAKACDKLEKKSTGGGKDLDRSASSSSSSVTLQNSLQKADVNTSGRIQDSEKGQVETGLSQETATSDTSVNVQEASSSKNIDGKTILDQEKGTSDASLKGQESAAHLSKNIDSNTSCEKTTDSSFTAVKSTAQLCKNIDGSTSGVKSTFDDQSSQSFDSTQVKEGKDSQDLGIERMDTEVPVDVEDAESMQDEEREDDNFALLEPLKPQATGGLNVTGQGKKKVPTSMSGYVKRRRGLRKRKMSGVVTGRSGNQPQDEKQEPVSESKQETVEESISMMVKESKEKTGEEVNQEAKESSPKARKESKETTGKETIQETSKESKQETGKESSPKTGKDSGQETSSSKTGKESKEKLNETNQGSWKDSKQETGKESEQEIEQGSDKQTEVATKQANVLESSKATGQESRQLGGKEPGEKQETKEEAKQEIGQESKKKEHLTQIASATSIDGIPSFTLGSGQTVSEARAAEDVSGIMTDVKNTDTDNNQDEPRNQEINKPVPESMSGQVKVQELLHENIPQTSGQETWVPKPRITARKHFPLKPRGITEIMTSTSKPKQKHASSVSSKQQEDQLPRLREETLRPKPPKVEHYQAGQQTSTKKKTKQSETPATPVKTSGYFETEYKTPIASHRDTHVGNQKKFRLVAQPSPMKQTTDTEQGEQGTSGRTEYELNLTEKLQTPKTQKRCQTPVPPSTGKWKKHGPPIPEGKYTRGTLVWGKMKGFTWWPAQIIHHHECGRNEAPSPDSRWVKWYGDGKFSLLREENLAPFEDFEAHFNGNYFKRVGLYKRALFEISMVAAKRCNKTPEPPVPEDILLSKGNPKTDAEKAAYTAALEGLLEWERHGFKPTGPQGITPGQEYSATPLAPRPPSPIEPRSVSSSNKPSTSGSPRNSPSKSLNKSPGKNVYEDKRDQHIDDLKTGKLLIKDMCIGCGELQIVTEHPMFEGGFCEVCRIEYLEVAYLFDTDGYQSYCGICAEGKEIMLCGQTGCGRSFCLDCVDLLVGPGESAKIKQQDPWCCFMCSDDGTHGMLVRRNDWNYRLLKFFQEDAIGDFAPLKTYPAVSIGKRRSIRVLSLFDGIGTAMLAMKELGFEVECYYASEINKDAITVASIRHEGAIQHIGDVREIDISKLESLGPIDLLIGGSPCNDLSIVNPARKGIYGNDGTGVLFFDFHRILMQLQNLQLSSHVEGTGSERPFFWLFENVVFMGHRDKVTISRFLECNPVMIDAKDLTPAHRARYFWGNLPGMSRPSIAAADDSLELQDVLERNCNRQAQFAKVRTITTKSNSVKQKGQLLPVIMEGQEDTLWCTEMERIFGFPEHYTDVANMNRTKRHQLLGQAWSVPVIKHLLAPLKDYFSCVTQESGSLS